MKKIKDFIFNKKVFMSAFAMVFFMLPLTSFAAETSIDTSTLTKVLTSVATSIKDVIGEVAPIALGVTALFLVWKYGVKFFKGLLG